MTPEPQKKPPVIRIMPYIDLKNQSVRTQEVFKDPWADLGLYLELAGFMAWRAMEYTEKRQDEVLDYVREYVKKCMDNYQETKLKQRNEKSN